MTRDPALDTRTLLPETRSGSSTLDRSSLRTSHSDIHCSTLGQHSRIHPNSGSVCPPRARQHFTTSGLSSSSSGSELPNSRCFNCSSSSSRTTTVHIQKFEYCFLKISLKPFRHYSKASKSLKPTPFRPQNNISPLLPSSDSLYSTHADRTPKPDLHSPKF